MTVKTCEQLPTETETNPERTQKTNAKDSACFISFFSSGNMLSYRVTEVSWIMFSKQKSFFFVDVHNGRGPQKLPALSSKKKKKKRKRATHLFQIDHM